MIRGALLAIALAGCTAGIDPAWQLDHDRVIAVRSTPPRIASGEVAAIDALLGTKGAPPAAVDPDTAEVVSPARLAAGLARGPTHWTVTAPGSAELDAARTELALDAGAPVPLRLRVRFTDAGLVAFKVVWLGEHADNPVLGGVLIDGKDGLAEAELAVPAGVDVALSVPLDTSYDINWLTSCGTMHDFDLAKAHLRVEPADPHSGSFALVVRDARGGAAWRLWPITAQ